MPVQSTYVRNVIDSPGQFVELDRDQIFIRLLENGIASTPFPAKTLAG